MKSDNILEKAILFATQKHSGQVRKGDKRPYILHPLSVMTTLGKIKKSKNQTLLFIAAILHDVVEDCNVSLEEIAHEFGYNVAAIVQELTSDKEEIGKRGKAEYLLEKMITMSSYSLIIKLVDRLDNISDMDSMSDEFKTRSVEQTLYIIDGLEKSRKLTETHRKLIDLIRDKISQYTKK
jgi:(p)ppGpp synthase/HD superfamily hydrolase